MSLSLTNGMGGAKQPFIPLNPGKVRMYACPTVCNHIGNARPVVFDVLARHFGRVIHART
ncbi:hypothetical protein [Paenirhodobacter sp.]|uniref:hypothetical protein n=1 Tax=Paenirhodobacter sp. TaxID=1965326 RepID=UPI003B3D275E